MLLIEGLDEHHVVSSAVDLVDLATGVCTYFSSFSLRRSHRKLCGWRLFFFFFLQADHYWLSWIIPYSCIESLLAEVFGDSTRVGSVTSSPPPPGAWGDRRIVCVGTTWY
jgi:hypothetical protein